MTTMTTMAGRYGWGAFRMKKGNAASEKGSEEEREREHRMAECRCVVGVCH
jgi:hypothetical protein